MTSYHVKRAQILDEYYRLIGKGNMKTATLLLADLIGLLSERLDAFVGTPVSTSFVHPADPPVNGYYKPDKTLSDTIVKQPVVAPEPAENFGQLDLFQQEQETVVQPERFDKLGRRIGVRGVIRPHVRTVRKAEAESRR